MLYILAYCVVCWAICCWRLSNNAAIQMALENDPSNARCLQIGFAGAILFSPLYLPVTLITYPRGWLRNWQAQRQYAEYCSHHRDPENTPVNFFDLDPDIQEYFSQTNPALFSAGFSMVGDIRSESGYCEMVSRVFLSDDGQVFANVWAVDGVPMGLITLLSIDSDGVVLETSNQASQGPTPAVDNGILSNAVESYDIGEVVTSHLEMMANNANDILAFAEQNYPEVSRYAARCSSRWLHSIGEIVDAPPTPEFHQLDPVSG